MAGRVSWGGRTHLCVLHICGGRTETRVSGGVNGVKKKEGAARGGAGQGDGGHASASPASI